MVAEGVGIAFVALWWCYVCGRYERDIVACMRAQKLKEVCSGAKKVKAAR